MQNINIRKAEFKDIQNLTVLKQQVWIDTYATEGIRNEFSEYVLSEFTIEIVGETIADQDKLVLVAEIEEHLIGCAEIGFNEKCSDTSVTEPEIMVLYILNRFCGMGIGAKLLTASEQAIKESGFSGAWLTVYHKNNGAIRFYERQGYKSIGSTHFDMGNNKYENFIMYKVL